MKSLKDNLYIKILERNGYKLLDPKGFIEFYNDINDDLKNFGSIENDGDWLKNIENNNIIYPNFILVKNGSLLSKILSFSNTILQKLNNLDYELDFITEELKDNVRLNSEVVNFAINILNKLNTILIYYYKTNIYNYSVSNKNYKLNTSLLQEIPLKYFNFESFKEINKKNHWREEYCVIIFKSSTTYKEIIHILFENYIRLLNSFAKEIRKENDDLSYKLISISEYLEYFINSYSFRNDDKDGKLEDFDLLEIHNILNILDLHNFNTNEIYKNI